MAFDNGIVIESSCISGWIEMDEGVQNVHQILCFFPRIFIIWRPLLRQHWAAIGCTKNDQPVRVTVHSDLLKR